MDNLLPHEWLMKCALDDTIEMQDSIIDLKTKELTILIRPLSIRERLEAAKAAAPFFAPTLKSIEASVKGDLDGASEEELIELFDKLGRSMYRHQGLETKTVKKH